VLFFWIALSLARSRDFFFGCRRGHHHNPLILVAEPAVRISSHAFAIDSAHAAVSSSSPRARPKCCAKQRRITLGIRSA